MGVSATSPSTYSPHLALGSALPLRCKSSGRSVGVLSVIPMRAAGGAARLFCSFFSEPFVELLAIVPVDVAVAVEVKEGEKQRVASDRSE